MSLKSFKYINISWLFAYTFKWSSRIWESVGAFVKQIANGPFTGLGVGLATQYGRQASQVVGMDRVLRGPPMPLQVPITTIGRWIFDALKKQSPDFVLLVEADTDRTITVKDVLASSSKLAIALRKYGVCRGDVVAIIGENTIDLTVCGIATLIMGAVMAPIDPLLKSLEHQHILKILNPKVVITDANIVMEVKDALDKLESDASIITVQRLERFDYLAWVIATVEDEEAEEFEPIDGNERDTAVIACSSGTTGMPKGVALSHYAIAYQVTLFASNWLKGYCLHTSYFYWISGVLIMIGTTINGVPRVLVRTTDPLAVLTTIEKYKPVFGLMAPSFMSQVLDHPRVGEFDLTSILALTAAGSPLTKALLDKVQMLLPGCIIAQGYGASEVCGLITHSRPPIDVLSLGKIVPDVHVKIVNIATMEAVDADTDGELLCKSPSLMNEYVGNPEATREAVDDGGWYHTGDIGRYTPEGILYITGRAKELLKVAGHQISPAEIESVIMSVEGVADVAVAGITQGDDQLPMALVVLKEGAQVSEEDVATAVRDNLSDFKQLRAGVKFVDSLPRTSTGKLKRIPLQELAESLY